MNEDPINRVAGHFHFMLCGAALDRRLNDYRDLDKSLVVSSYMGNGGSDMLTVGDAVAFIAAVLHKSMSDEKRQALEDAGFKVYDDAKDFIDDLGSEDVPWR